MKTRASRIKYELTREEMELKYEFFGKEELMTLNLRIIDLRKDRLGEEKSVLDIMYTRKKTKRIAV